MTSVGMADTSHLAARARVVPVFTLHTLKSRARAATTGFMARHGGHHGTQKSTRTGPGSSSTSRLKLYSSSSTAGPPLDQANPERERRGCIPRTPALALGVRPLRRSRSALAEPRPTPRLTSGRGSRLARRLLDPDVLIVRLGLRPAVDLQADDA